jgi:DNA-3-methyladenine glycosylase II
MGEKMLLSGENEAVRRLCERDPLLAKVVSLVGEISYEPYRDAFRFLAEIIIGQMLSNKVAEVLSARFAALCGGDVTPEAVGRLSVEEIKGIGVSTRKAESIRQMAALVEEGAIRLGELPGLSDGEVTARLTSIKGVGNWSAKMYLIFVLDRPDVLPYEDGAFLQAYRWLYRTEETGREAVEERCRAWRPYASIGARYLYQALDMGLTKTEFPPEGEFPGEAR